MDAPKCEDNTALASLSSITALQQTNLMCLQLGLLTYYSGLLTIEIALTHAAVYKVSLYSAHES